MMDRDEGVTRREAAQFLAVAAGASLTVAKAATAPANADFHETSVEWLVDPLGIDTQSPRFRWQGMDGQIAFRLRLREELSGRMIFDTGRIGSTSSHWQPEQPLSLKDQTSYTWFLATHRSGKPGGERLAGRFTTGLLSPAGWKARWIAATPDLGPSHQPLEGRGNRQPSGSVMPLFRRRFDCPRDVRKAILSICGLGQYRCAINDQTIGAGVLDPAWSDYRTSVPYDTFDVTAAVRRGANTLGVRLGNGFYNVEGVEGRYTKLIGSYGQPKLIARLRIVHADGQETIITSDDRWETRPGPIRYSSIYGGEDFDAREDVGHWDRDDRDWQAAQTVEGPGGTLRNPSLPPMGIVETVPPVSIREPVPGTLVFDFGVNFAGRPRLRVTGTHAGQTIRMLPGELLLADGTIDQMSMTGASRPGPNGIAFQYVSAGAPNEEWEPAFSYTGFRYLQVEGVARAQISELVGRVVQLTLAAGGTFSCDRPDVDRIHRLIGRALTSNLASVMTDCPHREKLGWLEQIYLNAPTVLCNWDAITLYEKVTRDMIEAQRSDGMVPSIAPEYVAFVDAGVKDTIFRDSPEWGSAIVLAPWAVYRRYGDATILRSAWAGMRRYVDYLEGRAKDGLLDVGLGDWFDIGPKAPGPSQLTSRHMTGTATLYADLRAMTAIAAILGERDRAADYAGRAEAVKRTICARLYDPTTGNFDRGSQTANAMALALGIAPPEDRARIVENIVGDLRNRSYHVSAGDIGFHYLVRALSENGRSDVLLEMLQQTSAPSYGAQLAAGATALTEAWNSARHASQNHFMLGHIEAWLYEGLGGVSIDFAADGPPIRIAPQIVAGVSRVAVTQKSVFGTVASSWRHTSSALALDVTIPPGTEAVVTVPTSNPSTVTFGKGSRASTELSRGPGFLALKVPSGRHRISSRLEKGAA